jgi:hypothetical protein
MSKKINAYPGLIHWNKSLCDPELIIEFRRKGDNYKTWYALHLKLTPDIVSDCVRALKEYIVAWWNSKCNTFRDIKDLMKFD